jgi:menaquinone-9 beta-reductase
VRRTAALIAGGGPAGAAAAITLAQGGARPLLIERQAEPQDVVCGGFLGWDALSSLDALGIDAMALGARPISMMRLIAGERRVEAALPHMAAGLSRRTLDAALLDRAAAAGAAIERGVAIRRAKGPTTVQTGSG